MSDSYPKGIEMELRNAETDPGEGLLVEICAVELFWSDLTTFSTLEIITGYDEGGDCIRENIYRVANDEYPESRDCFRFRGEVYDFCCFRSIDKCEG